MSAAETIAPEGGTEAGKTREITIAGKEFSVDVPFGEGYVLNAAEASQLNQVYLENIGNNFRKRVQELLDGGSDEATIQAELDKYVEGYSFGSRRSGGARRVHDPILREMRALAKAKLVVYVKEKNGVNWNDMESEQREVLMSKYLEKYGDVLRPIAERRVAAAAEVAGLEDLEV